MTLTLPEINGSDGVWGQILNDALNGLDTRVTNNTTATTTNTGNITTLTGRVNGHDTAISNNTSAINQLDNRVDTIEAGGGATGRIYSMTVNVTTASGTILGQTGIGWPAGTFTATPAVVATINSGATANERSRYIARIQTPSSTGVTVEVTRGDGQPFSTTSDVSVCLIAHQL